jgi:hypothetical protein
MRAATHDALFATLEKVGALTVTHTGEYTHTPVFTRAMREERWEFGLCYFCHIGPFWGLRLAQVSFRFFSLAERSGLRGRQSLAHHVGKRSTV